MLFRFIFCSISTTFSLILANHYASITHIKISISLSDEFFNAQKRQAFIKQVLSPTPHYARMRTVPKTREFDLSFKIYFPILHFIYFLLIKKINYALYSKQTDYAATIFHIDMIIPAALFYICSN